MQVRAEKLDPNTRPLDIIDKAASALNQIWGDDSNRMYRGVFALPYLDKDQPEILQQESMTVYFDENVGGEPQSYAWRWWGFRGKRLVEELDRLGLEIREKEKVNE